MHTHWMDNGTLGVFTDPDDSDEEIEAVAQILKRFDQLHAEIAELKACACVESDHSVPCEETIRWIEQVVGAKLHGAFVQAARGIISTE